MKKLLALLALSTAAAFAVPTLVSVSQTLYRADGTAYTGSVYISWQSFTAASGDQIPAGNKTVPLTTAGLLTVTLAANVGATPVGTAYTVAYRLNLGNPQTVAWTVPASGPVTVTAIESTVLPQPSSVVALSQLSSSGATNGQCLVFTSGAWAPGTCATGSVTSVGLSLPAMFSVSGSPVTGAGTLTATLANQSANVFLAGPTSGGAATPTFRALVAADLPAGGSGLNVITATATSNVLTFGSTCAALTPCIVGNGVASTSIVTGGTATAASGTGSLWLYVVQPGGTLTVGSASTLTVTITGGWTANTSATGFPTGSVPLYSCTTAATVYTCTDARQGQTTKTVSAGTGITVTHNANGDDQVSLPTVAVANGGTGVTTAQGNGSKVQLSTGSATTNDCVKFDANGNTVDAGAVCGGAGSPVAPNGATPYGGIPAAGQNYQISPTANQMSYSIFTVPSPGWNLSSITYMAHTTAGDHVTACIYDFTGALLANGQGTPVGVMGADTTANTVNFTSLVLTPGSYFLGMVSHNDSGITTLWTGTLFADGWAAVLANSTLNSSTYVYFRGPSGANLATGTTTLTCPATAGTRTIVGATGGGSASVTPTVSFN